MGDLTTIALVKAMLGITGATEDTILARLVSAASSRIERAAGRTLTQATYTAEAIDSIGDFAVKLSQYPIVSITSVAELGTTLTASDYTTDDGAGLLWRMSGSSPIPWAVGRRAIAVTYVAGYANVPKDVEDAATQQAAYEWRKSKAGGDRLGVTGQILGPGSSNYTVGEWAPGVDAVVASYRRLC